VSHEVIAAAAFFRGEIKVDATSAIRSLTIPRRCVQAAKAYEKHVEKEGKPANHKVAVELLCVFVARLNL